MPSKNIIKEYVENGYYHIYNRGVEKRDIFLDEQDCVVFLHYLKLYLSPVEELKQLDLPGLRVSKFIRLNLSAEIDLLAFALMPNHIHLQIKQKTTDGIVKLMKRLATAYVMYFNKKYLRVGSLFQNTYKATLIKTDEYLLHLSRYIHLNPAKITHKKIIFKEFSSYPYYLGQKQTSWIKPQEILGYFRSAQRKDLKDILSYQSFVEDFKESSTEVLGPLILEDE
ncbi:transposase [Candidatus Daviesbacteria bacterium]|nr:transposase [Candidatus Daviesbacteria bacterium]